MKTISRVGVTTLILCLTLISCGGGGGGGGGSDEAAFDADTQAAILAAVNKQLRAYGGTSPVPGAVVGVWAPNKGTFVQAVGVSDLSTGEPLSTSDHFRIASITKSFVMSVILQLVDEGKLSLDDTISKFNIGVRIPNAGQITIRELGNMTSGIPDIYHVPQLSQLDLRPTVHIAPQTLIGLAAENGSSFSPGSQWEYSDTNYFVLGLIVEKVTHDTIQNQIQQRLLAPLGLTATVFPEDDPSLPVPFTHGYTLDSDREWFDDTISLPPSLYWATGAMISTLPDLKIWVRAFVGGALNSAATQAERLNCIPSTEGGDQRFGLGVVCTGGWYGYTGGIEGYNAAAYYLPSADATIVVLANTLHPVPAPGVASSIVRDVARIIFPNNIPFR